MERYSIRDVANKTLRNHRGPESLAYELSYWLNHLTHADRVKMKASILDMSGGDSYDSYITVLEPDLRAALELLAE